MTTPLETEVLHFLSEPEEGGFDALALAIFNYQRRENPIYARYCEFLDTPKQIDSWERIPAVPQGAFKRSALRSFPAHQTKTEFRTSGTTGEGHGTHFLPSTRLYEAAVQRAWDYFCLPRHRLILLMPHPDDAPFSSLSHMGGILAKFDRNRFVIAKNGEFELDRLHHRHLGGIFAFENAAGVDADLAVSVGNAGAIADEAAGDRGSAGFISRRNRGLGGERHQFVAPAVEERPRSDQQCTGRVLREASKGIVDFGFVVGLQDPNRQADRAGRRLDIGLEAHRSRPIGVDEHRDDFRLRDQIAQKPEPLGGQPEKIVTPVALPPGLARLATKPIRTGSSPLRNVIGIVLVAASAGAIDGLLATITDTRRLTRSAASAGSRS